MIKIENFGKNVARLRKKRGLKQEELAELLGVSKQTISAIETGERYTSFENLAKLSDIFNAEAIDFFGTESEIAVSSTPVILDRIDEYNSKVQALLKVEHLLKDENFISEFNDYIFKADNLLNTKDLLQDETFMLEIEKLLKKIYEITAFTKPVYITDEYGDISTDRQGNPRIADSEIEIVEKSISGIKNDMLNILENKQEIINIKKDIEFILENKDKVK